MFPILFAATYFVCGEVSEEVFWSVCNSLAEETDVWTRLYFWHWRPTKVKKKNEQILAPYQCVSNADRIKHACDHVKEVKHFTGPYSGSVSF